MSDVASLHAGAPLGAVSQQRLLQALLRQSLGAFAERCFCEIEGDKKYVHNWHLDAIAHHLTMVFEGRCRRLVITLPPRSLKSLYASTAFPAWVLGHDPHRRIICVSYGRNLTTAHATASAASFGPPGTKRCSL